MTPDAADISSGRDRQSNADRCRLYRQRAEELRVIAEDAMVEENRRVLLRLADSYERMARSLEPTPEAAAAIAPA